MLYQKVLFFPFFVLDPSLLGKNNCVNGEAVVSSFFFFFLSFFHRLPILIQYGVIDADDLAHLYPRWLHLLVPLPLHARELDRLR